MIWNGKFRINSRSNAITNPLLSSGSLLPKALCETLRMIRLNTFFMASESMIMNRTEKFEQLTFHVTWAWTWIRNVENITFYSKWNCIQNLRINILVCWYLMKFNGNDVQTMPQCVQKERRMLHWQAFKHRCEINFYYHWLNQSASFIRLSSDHVNRWIINVLSSIYIP